MINALTLILACQLAGETLVRAVQVPVPGPVAGMVMLFVFLLVRGRVPDDLGVVADGLLRNLSLLFVPAGVGVMLHFRLLGADWPALAAALIVSTLATIAVTAFVMARLTALSGRADDNQAGEGR